MSRYLATSIAGVLTGVAALGMSNSQETGEIYDQLRDRGPGTQIEVGEPTTRVDHLAAFAVGKNSGIVTVVGDYDKVRWGPAPNCNIKITMELPFIAEPIVKLSDLEITTGPPDNAGKYDVDVAVDGRVEVLNPRTILNDPVVEHEGNGYGQICDEQNYDDLINTMWEIGGKATNTAAECLVGSVNTQYITDAAGNLVQTDASAAIHEIYDADLKLALGALYPDAKSIDVVWPDPDPGYDISQTASYQELEAAIAATDDDKYDISADPIKSCTFESLTLDVASTQGN
jgi:hypothetical protein